MRSTLSIILILLWYGNTAIADQFLPYDGQKDKYQFFLDWYYVRCNIYEVMFLVGAIIALLKKDRLSQAILSGAALLFACSVVDKLIQNVYSYEIHDIWALLAATLVAIKVYKK
jgi:uncharacterized membrane protein